MRESDHIVIEKDLAGVARHDGYLCHAYCHQGDCSFTFNEWTCSMGAGDCMVVRRSDLFGFHVQLHGGEKISTTTPDS